MEFTNNLSDSAVLQLLGERISTHRLNKNLTQAQLAKEAGVSHSTLTRMEAGDASNTTNLIRVLRALGILENLDLVVPEPAVSPIQQLKLAGKVRQRARQPTTSTKTESASGPWAWEIPEDKRSGTPTETKTDKNKSRKKHT